MEKLSSIVDAIKERLTNPLFLSFLISWLCWNWQIPVALLWFDTNQLHSTANWNYVDYVRSQLDCWSVIVPILFALGYTFGMPLLMNRVRQFNAWIVKKGNDLVFKESQESKVSFENYYTVLHGNEEKARKLEEMIENQNNLRANYDKSQKQNVELETVITARDKELKILKDEKKVIADDHKSNIDKKDFKIETMQIAIDELSKENVTLKSKNEKSLQKIGELESTVNGLNFDISNQQINMDADHKKVVDELTRRHSITYQDQQEKLHSLGVEFNNCTSERHRLLEIKELYDLIRHVFDVKVIDGKWKMQIISPDEGEIRKDVYIDDGSMYLEQNSKVEILNFYAEGNSISFVTKNYESEKPYEYYVLAMDEKGVAMNGTIDGRKRVYLTKTLEPQSK